MADLTTWTDREMIDEFKRLEDADCLRLDVWVGGRAQSSRDASHYLPRLLALAERGLSRPTSAEGE